MAGVGSNDRPKRATLMGIPKRVTVRLSDALLDKAVDRAVKRFALPVSRITKTNSFETRDGDPIEMYEHSRDYPPELIVPGIAPTQTTEMRGWRCPNCQSRDTSVWSGTTIPYSGEFECNSCGAHGGWGNFCRRSGQIHIGGTCTCSPMSSPSVLVIRGDGK